jgi:hypothetical protein
MSLLILFAPQGSPPASTTIYVKVGGVWTEGVVYTKVSGAWTSGAIKAKVGGSWV